METFERIAAQWPFILSVLCFFVVIYFRKAIRTFLSNTRITRIAGVSVDDKEENKEIEEIPQEKKFKKESQSIENDIEESAEGVKKQDDQPSLSAILIYILQGDFDEAENMFDLLENEAKNGVEKSRINVVYRYYLLNYGNVSSLIALEKYVLEEVKDTKILALGNYYIGLVHGGYSNYENALEFLEKAYEHLESEDDKVNCAIKICTCHSNLSGIEKGILELKKYLSSFEQGLKARIYDQLADFYEEKGDKEMQFFALEMAHSNQVHSKDYEFSSAYNAGDEGVFKFVQLHHYNNLLNKVAKSDRLYESVTNNRGVVLSNLNLKGLSIDNYKRSKDSNGTIAVANLAYVLIGAGFYDLAEEFLDKASKLKKTHENVWSALKDLKKAKENEREKFDQFSTMGKKIYLLTQKLAERKFKTFDEKLDLNGEWQLNEVDNKDIVTRKSWTDFEVEIENKLIKFSWKEKDDKTGFLEIEFAEDFTGKAKFSDKKGKFISFGEYDGYAILDQDQIDVFVNRNDDVRFFRLKR